jgi:hypothetical protein
MDDCTRIHELMVTTHLFCDIAWLVCTSSITYDSYLYRIQYGWQPSARGYNWATLFLGDINTGNLALQVEGVSNETVKYDREFCGTSTQEWLLWQGLEAIVQVNYRPVLSSERVLQNNKHATVWRKFQRERKIGHSPRWVPDTKTDWLTDCRSQINFNFNSVRLTFPLQLRQCDNFNVNFIITYSNIYSETHA